MVGVEAARLYRLEQAVRTWPRRGAIPVLLDVDRTITWPDVIVVAHVIGWGGVSVIHFDTRRGRGGAVRVTAVRVVDRARAADAAADRVWRDPRRPVPADRAAWLPARAAVGLDGRAVDVRFEMAEIVALAWTAASPRRSPTRSTSTTRCVPISCSKSAAPMCTC